jgi:hypothetical protein
MPLASNLTLTALFGNSAVVNTPVGGLPSDSTVTFKLTELGVGNNIDTASPQDLSPEGIFLAILQKVHISQGEDAARILTIDRLAPTITTRGPTPTDTVRTERYAVTIYSKNGIGILDPDIV